MSLAATGSSAEDYASLGVEEFLIKALAAMAIRLPTAVQSACIPPILQGRDCIGQAQTGSGKTIAFALPILQALARDPFGVFAIVLTPTRCVCRLCPAHARSELAFQIHEQFSALGAAVNARTSVCVGGMDMMTQAMVLDRRPHIVVATPGRLADLLRSNPSDWGLKRARFLVLDEADRLLEPGFADDLGKILSSMSSERQTLLFTATVTEPILALSRKPPGDSKQPPFLHLSEQSCVSRPHCPYAHRLATPRSLRQLYIFIPAQVRECYLFFLLAHLSEYAGVSKGKRKAKDEEDEDEIEPLPPTIVFVSRCRMAAQLAYSLEELGIDNVALHSRRTQRERLAALDAFRAGRVPLLIATDVGSRGLDIPAVECVINLDVPRAADDYIHRVGRTARAGRRGVSVTFVTEGDVDLVEAVETRVGSKMELLALPEERVLENLNKVSTAQRVALLQLNADKFGDREETHKKKAQSGSKKSKRKKTAA